MGQDNSELATPSRLGEKKVRVLRSRDKTLLAMKYVTSLIVF